MPRVRAHSQRRVLPAAGAVLRARLARLVLHAGAQPTGAGQDAAQGQDGQGDQYRAVDQLRLPLQSANGLQTNAAIRCELLARPQALFSGAQVPLPQAGAKPASVITYQICCCQYSDMYIFSTLYISLRKGRRTLILNK